MAKEGELSPDVKNLATAICARAAATCDTNGTTVETYYEAAMKQFNFLIGITGEECGLRASQKLLQYIGCEAEFVAVNIIVHRLSLDEVLLPTVQHGLPLEQRNAARRLPESISDAEVELRNSNLVRWADIPTSDDEVDLCYNNRVPWADIPGNDSLSSTSSHYFFGLRFRSSSWSVDIR